ncbi:uncharacterized protein EV420DRAFT_1754057 [Desarmillaria tabescens]|uniref:Mid2 domain-containing protein n=1 Tax=Armillaria tabescens TaxID=1929756 RepID=A0AA39MJ93_ARMTA|nr:uncharacterized protein EV420DRAFT_1754057 [Desarmillaria tabescens]KAK0435440.1 hypothetical protein EV420DRAFT_1754057 [Desarmillaria tabescens]
MSLSLFRMCIFAIILPLALSLNISLDGPAVLFQRTPINLHWTSGDPDKFNLGVYQGKLTEDVPNHHLLHVPVNQVVTHFTQYKVVYMTFNISSPSPVVKDYILLAWINGHHNNYANSSWFTVELNTTPTLISTSTILGTTVTASTSLATTELDPQAGQTTTASASSAQTKPSSHTGAIVGGVLGSLALLSIISGLALFMLRKRRRSRNSAPSRVFWKYLDEKKGPPSSEPLQYPSPTYSPAVRVRPLSLGPEDYYHRINYRDNLSIPSPFPEPRSAAGDDSSVTETTLRALMRLTVVTPANANGSLHLPLSRQASLLAPGAGMVFTRMPTTYQRWFIFAPRPTVLPMSKSHRPMQNPYRIPEAQALMEQLSDQEVAMRNAQLRKSQLPSGDVAKPLPSISATPAPATATDQPDATQIKADVELEKDATFIQSQMNDSGSVNGRSGQYSLVGTSGQHEESDVGCVRLLGRL